MNNKRTKCVICKKATFKKMVSSDNASFICQSCHDTFFSDLYSEHAKITRLIDAMSIAQEHNLSIGIALNVARKRYSIQEAKDRMRLKKREQQGKSTDIYSIGKRLHGSYK